MNQEIDWDAIFQSKAKAGAKIAQLIFEDNEEMSTSELVEQINQEVKKHNDFVQSQIHHQQEGSHQCSD